MIDRREILEAASAFSLLPNIVEKDYVLGWMLAGINAHEVGYESATQLNHEYSRFFGQRPKRDIRTLRSPGALPLESVISKAPSDPVVNKHEAQQAPV
jgi:hypothetical protein